jgi:hypothetical protein
VLICRSRSDDFLLIFSKQATADRVLHAPVQQEVDFSLIFRRWRCQARARFSPLRYKVLLAIDNVSAHVWLLEVVQTIIASLCLSFELAPASVSRTNMSHFFMVAWALNLDLIPNEVGCAIPEPEEPVVGLPLLFVRAEELIHSKQDSLQFRAFIHVLEMHDFSPPPVPPDNGCSWSLDSNEEGDDGYPGYDIGPGLLRPWPRVYHLAENEDEAGNQLPLLPQHGGDARWPASTEASSPMSMSVRVRTSG